MPLTDQEITQLYREHSPLMLRFLMRRTFDAQAAVDLLAETFATAFENRATCDGMATGRQWVYGIANNLVAEFFRDGQIERRAVDRLGVQVPAVEDVDLQRIEELAGTAELRSAVATALAQLSDDHRVALDLRVVQERSYTETAQKMGVTEQVARARVSRALRSLREVIGTTTPEEAIEHA